MNNILDQIAGSIVYSVSQKYQGFVELSPSIFGALLIFLLGILIGEAAYRIVVGLGHKVYLEKISDSIGLSHFLGHLNYKKSSTGVIAKALRAYLIFVFFIEATKIAKLQDVSEFGDRVIAYIPRLLVALFIMIVGIRLGNLLSRLVITSLDFVKSHTSHFLGAAIKYTVMMFAILAALAELEIAPILVQIVFIGFISMMALAGGLAFGLGGKDVVKELLDAVKKIELKHLKKRQK